MKISVSGKAAVAANPLINRLRSELQRAELSDGVILRYIVAERRIYYMGCFHLSIASPMLRYLLVSFPGAYAPGYSLAALTGLCVAYLDILGAMTTAIWRLLRR